MKIEKCRKCGEVPIIIRTQDNDYFYALKCKCGEFSANAIEDFCIEQWNAKQREDK